MLHELQRRNYSPSTIRGYLNAVSQFAEYFRRSPEQLGPEHLRRYQRYLLQERKLAPSTVEMRISALRFLFKRTLKRRDLAFDDLIFPKVPHKLPTVLGQEKIVRLIDAAPNRLYPICSICVQFLTKVILQTLSAITPEKTHTVTIQSGCRPRPSPITR